MSATGFLIRSLPFAVENDIAWRLNLRLHRRPSSAPFLSGDTFRCKADLVIEEDEEFSYRSADGQQLVFCASELAADFLTSKRLSRDFVLIVHHGDKNIGDDFLAKLDTSSCSHCFAQNCLVKDPRITPLPIGLEDQWHHQHGHVKDFTRLRKKTADKIPRIAWGFSLHTNPDGRWPCYRALWKNPVAVSLPEGLNSRLYHKSIYPYMFMASPPGNGEDCYRTWEALYLRIVPIVKRSVMTEFFASLGLPMVLVDDWREITSWDESYLVEIYQRLAPGFDSAALWLPYWETLFRRHLESAW